MEKIIVAKLLKMIEEDSPYGDITTDMLIPENCAVRAVVVAKESCIVAGNRFVIPLLREIGIEVIRYEEDGTYVDRGSIVIEMEGRARDLLLIERTILNLLSHLSGIATYTRRLVEMVKRVNPKLRIAATRKCLPGLAFFEKYAVAVGGGDTHRFSLSDMVLIKDNHIAIIGSIEEAVRRSRERASFSKKIEVEVRSPEDAVKAAKAGADIVMLDNMSVDDVRKTIDLLKREKLRDRVLIEVSGGINEENILEYAKLDVDIISLSRITMAAPPVDLSLDIAEVRKC